MSIDAQAAALTRRSLLAARRDRRAGGPAAARRCRRDAGRRDLSRHLERCAQDDPGAVFQEKCTAPKALENEDF